MQIHYRLNNGNKQEIFETGTPDLPLLGKFLNSYFSMNSEEFIDNIEYLKKMFEKVLKKKIGDNQPTIVLGTRKNDFVLERVGEKEPEEIRIADASALEWHEYPGWCSYIAGRTLSNAVHSYIAERKKYVENPEAYKAELDKLGGEKIIEIT